jgi:hypothetical protein
MKKIKGTDDKVGLAAYAKLSPEGRAFIENRQGQTLFTDIDGATEALNEQGENVSRSSMGRINQYLQETAALLTVRNHGIDLVMSKLEGKMHDPGLVANAILVASIIDAQSKLNLDKIDYDALPDEQKIALGFDVFPKALDKVGKSTVNLEGSKDKESERIKKEALANELAKAAIKSGISSDTAEAWRAEFLGLEYDDESDS